MTIKKVDIDIKKNKITIETETQLIELLIEETNFFKEVIEKKGAFLNIKYNIKNKKLN